MPCPNDYTLKHSNINWGKIKILNQWYSMDSAEQSKLCTFLAMPHTNILPGGLPRGQERPRVGPGLLASLKELVPVAINILIKKEFNTGTVLGKG